MEFLGFRIVGFRASGFGVLGVRGLRLGFWFSGIELWSLGQRGGRAE